MSVDIKLIRELCDKSTLGPWYEEFITGIRRRQPQEIRALRLKGGFVRN